MKKNIVIGFSSLLCLTSGVVYVSLNDKQPNDTEASMMAANPTAKSLPTPAENTIQSAQSLQPETDTAAFKKADQDASVDVNTPLVIPPFASDNERETTRAVREEYLPVYLQMVDENIADLTDQIAIAKKNGQSPSETAKLQTEIFALNKMKKKVMERNKDVVK